MIITDAQYEPNEGIERIIIGAQKGVNIICDCACGACDCEPSPSDCNDCGSDCRSDCSGD